MTELLTVQRRVTLDNTVRYTVSIVELQSTRYFTEFYVTFSKLLPSNGCSLNAED